MTATCYACEGHVETSPSARGPRLVHHLPGGAPIEDARLDNFCRGGGHRIGTEPARSAIARANVQRWRHGLELLPLPAKRNYARKEHHA